MVDIPNTRMRILNFIRGFLKEKGYAPTVRDIARGCHISTPSVVQHHLNILEREGYIRRDPEIFRSIQLLGRETKDIIKVPLLGSIAAGEPIPVPTSDTWRSAAEEILDLTEEVTGGRQNIFALRVKGSSMIDALVDDGDIVLMELASTANDGEMVALWLKEEQEVTLKRLYREPGRIRLQPANSQMEPIYTEPENIEVQGKVIGVIRKL